MECPICLVNWNSTSCIPRMMQCGHSMCQGCLELFLNKNGSSLQCPICLKQHVYTTKDQALEQICKNFALISLLEMNSEQTKTTKGHEGSEGLKASKQNKALSSSHSEIDPNQIIVALRQGGRTCQIHYKPYVFYRPTTDFKDISLLCPLCVSEDNTNIQPLQEAVEEIKQKQVSFKIHHTKSKFILDQVRQNLPYLIQQQKQKLESQMNNHIIKIKDVVKRHEQRCKQSLSKAFKYLDQEGSGAERQLQEIDTKLDKIKKNFSGIKDMHEISEILRMILQLDDGYKYVSNFNLEAILEDVKVKIEGYPLVEQEFEHVIFGDRDEDRLLVKAAKLSKQDMVFELGSGHIPYNLAAGFIENTDHWICLMCHHNNNKIDEFNQAQIKCEKCEALRKIETNNDINIALNLAKEKDIMKSLRMRRLYEISLYKENLNISSQEETQMYLISKKWMKNWQEFVKINNTESPLLKKKDCYRALNESPNEGILPPSSISNYSLIKPLPESKSKMLFVRDKSLEHTAVLVNKKVWKMLRQIYGGGPTIISDGKEHKKYVDLQEEDVSDLNDLNEEEKYQNKKALKAERYENDDIDFNVVDVENIASVPEFQTHVVEGDEHRLNFIGKKPGHERSHSSKKAKPNIVNIENRKALIHYQNNHRHGYNEEEEEEEDKSQIYNQKREKPHMIVINQRKLLKKKSSSSRSLWFRDIGKLPDLPNQQENHKLSARMNISNNRGDAGHGKSHSKNNSAQRRPALAEGSGIDAGANPKNFFSKFESLFGIGRDK